jgi:hypothetical protein
MSSNKREGDDQLAAEEPQLKKARANSDGSNSVPAAASSNGDAMQVDSDSTSSGSPKIVGSNGHPIDTTPVIRVAKKVLPDTFDVHEHFYPRAVNSNLHPMVQSFLSLGNERIIERFCHLNPSVSMIALTKLLSTPPRFFRWSGADLFNVTNQKGKRQMIVVETNSCPSGQKSMPMINNDDNEDGYHILMRSSFKTMLDEREASEFKLPQGGLAVIYDKNPMEAGGYAAAMADVFKEPVYLAELYVREKDPDPPVKWIADVMHVRDAAGAWIPIRACFRYVTQRPWDRIPMSSKTLILNSILSCLAGGRNKMAADKAYEFLNNELADTGLEIRTPETIRDVSKNEIPIWVKSMGGHAVVKVPYSNAGQGVYTITGPEELAAFMAEDQRYNKYIVQSLVGASTWSSVQRGGAFFHAGTIPVS